MWQLVETGKQDLDIRSLKVAALTTLIFVLCFLLSINPAVTMLSLPLHCKHKCCDILIMLNNNNISISLTDGVLLFHCQTVLIYLKFLPTEIARYSIIRWINTVNKILATNLTLSWNGDRKITLMLSLSPTLIAKISYFLGGYHISFFLLIVMIFCTSIILS